MRRTEMFKTLKQIIKKLMRTIKSTKGNSLEFAVTTAMMKALKMLKTKVWTSWKKRRRLS